MTRRNQPPDRLPPEVRDHSEVVRACLDWNIGRLFRFVNNLTEEPAKFTVTHIGRLCGLSVSRVGEYMKDAHQVTSVGIIERIADGLHVPGERFGLAARPWEPSITASKSQHMMGAEVLSAAGQRLSPRRDRWSDGHERHEPQGCEDDVERRELFGLTGGAIVGGLLSTAEPLRRRVDSALTLPTTTYDADEWERTADQ